jgi:hypothetical protein
MTSLGSKQHLRQSATRTLLRQLPPRHSWKYPGTGPCVGKSLPPDPAVAAAVVLRGLARISGQS